MISKQHIKFIKSLQYKKYRKKANAFLVEGSKSVLELLSSGIHVQSITATSKFYHEFGARIPKYVVNCYETDESTLSRLGTFQSNDYVLAVATMIGQSNLTVGDDECLIALQDLQDPGNLGTIIRTADWYGIRKILISPDTVDFYNPKVISATKGSFTRVQVHTAEIRVFLENNPQLNVYGTYMEGDSLYETSVQTPAVIVFGNESRGIDAALARFINRKIMIPRIGEAESLNVAIAAAIVMDRFIRPR